MQILEITRRTPALLTQLLDVWERSVRATHTFEQGGPYPLLYMRRAK